MASIANCASLRAHLPRLRRLELTLVTDHILRTLRRFATLNGNDFSLRVTLLEAESVRCPGKLQAAESRYRQATERATAAGFTREQALVLEKHAELLMALGRVDDARATAEASIVRYLAWGAVAKVNQLRNRFDELQPSQVQ